ncbi:MAG: DUF2892 domain-containing protein [Bryobacteraceae bacterium]|nr:DUF2892 domain-containing protein [Bryobacteraceae bacterium]
MEHDVVIAETNMENGGRPPDRVRAHTAPEINRQVDQQAKDCVKAFASRDREEISRHIDELSREWDLERYLEANAAILALSGVVLGATVNRKFLIVPGFVLGFFLQHAIQGWCPPVPVFRRFGIRTRKEINREKYALKALRGDFDEVATSGEAAQPELK